MVKDFKSLKKVEVKWTIAIPEGEVKKLVKTGDKVERGEVVLEYLSREKILIPAADFLKKHSPEDKQKILDQIKEKRFGMGEVIFSKSGIFSKKVLASTEGEVVGIDEFDNLIMLGRESDSKEIIKSPVRGEVIKIDQDKITIGFKGWEIIGEPGGNLSKAWGDLRLKIIKNIFEIKSDLIEGKVVIVENPDKIWLMKAQVLGVMGVIVIGDKSEVDDLDLPIVGVEETNIKELLAKYKEEDLVRVLINSRLGRVLVVVQ
jgi:hypothetical protein